MKTVFRKDLREVLAGYAMLAVSLVMLEIIAIAGYLMKNQKLTGTCLTMIVFALVIAAMYVLFTAGRSFLGNLRSKAYYEELEEAGISRRKAVLYKFLYVTAAFVLFAVAYLGILYADIAVSLRMFPESREEMRKLDMMNVLRDEGTASAKQIAATVFEYLTAGTVMVALVFFVVTTVMAYYFYGETSIISLFEGRPDRRKAEQACIWVFRFLLLGMVVFGSLREAGVIWQLGDVGVGITAWINVIALLILCPQAIRALREYEQSLRKDPEK